MSLRFALVSMFLVGCGGLDSADGARDRADETEQGWWWLWTPPTHDDGDEGDDKEPEVPREPGDPDWFDAHCDDAGCTVADDFDPLAHLQLAHDLCSIELGIDALYFQRVWFEAERTYADELNASDADWFYTFVVPDPDDLWGYSWLECTISVNHEELVTDSGFSSDSIRPTRVNEMLDEVAYGIDHALDDLGGWNQVTRGGLYWSRVRGPEVFIADDRWDEYDHWSAVTGERDW